MGFTSITDVIHQDSEIKERVEKWRKYTPDVITNIDGHTNDNAVRTVNTVKFKDTDNIFGNDNEEHRNDDDRNESACREGILMEPTYADIAKRAK